MFKALETKNMIDKCVAMSSFTSSLIQKKCVSLFCGACWTYPHSARSKYLRRDISESKTPNFFFIPESGKIFYLCFIIKSYWYNIFKTKQLDIMLKTCWDILHHSIDAYSVEISSSRPFEWLRFINRNCTVQHKGVLGVGLRTARWMDHRSDWAGPGLVPGHSPLVGWLPPARTGLALPTGTDIGLVT
jgi:hypothetical protein